MIHHYFLFFSVLIEKTITIAGNAKVWRRGEPAGRAGQVAAYAGHADLPRGNQVQDPQRHDGPGGKTKG